MYLTSTIRKNLDFFSGPKISDRRSVWFEDQGQELGDSDRGVSHLDREQGDHLKASNHKVKLQISARGTKRLRSSTQ